MGKEYKYEVNPDTTRLEKVHRKALLLDQITPQNVNNGSPNFRAGLTIKADERLYFDGT
jgi:hypothetical protein